MKVGNIDKWRACPDKSLCEKPAEHFINISDKKCLNDGLHKLLSGHVYIKTRSKGIPGWEARRVYLV